jgi:hypothetical protein
MKPGLAAIAVLIFSAVSLSCATQPAKTTAIQSANDLACSKIVGTWTTGGGMFRATRHFNADGTYEEKAAGVTVGSGRWKLQADRLHWNVNEKHYDAELLKVTDARLTVRLPQAFQFQPSLRPPFDIFELKRVNPDGSVSTPPATCKIAVPASRIPA